jgi:calcineurin-like phosphoesterase family protein
MSSNIWFVSDTHFGHANFLNFVDANGFKVRVFDSVEDMDECMVERWNHCVKPGDKVYHLGDVFFGDGHRRLNGLHGHKRLIVGNHDDIKNSYLYNGFNKISMWRVFKEHDFICSHVPLREDSMMTTFNLHGHIHQNRSPSPRHVNMCVEHTQYRPLHLDEILAELAKRRQTIDLSPAV